MTHHDLKKDTVDLPCRAKIARGIAEYLNGSIDNFALDDLVSQVNTRDFLAVTITGQLWYLYDDTRRHKNEGGHQFYECIENMVWRWIYLLYSDWSYNTLATRDLLAESDKDNSILSWLRYINYGFVRLPEFRGNYYWPFRGQSEWEEWLQIQKSKQEGWVERSEIHL